MKHVFLFDPKSFFDRQWKMDSILDHIGQFFRTQENPDWSIQMSRYRRDAIIIIEDEAGKARPGDIVRVYAIGGEGILYDCVNAAAHFPNVQVAPIPYGEYSNYTYMFGEDKTEIFRDIPSIVQGKAFTTDLIRWGVNYALNSCYIGLNSAMAAKVKELKSVNKGIFLLFSKISNFINSILTAYDREMSAQEYKVIIDDADYSGHYCLIHIANGPYHSGKLTGLKSAVPNDGFLDIALIRSTGPLRTIWAIKRYARGKRYKNGIYLKAKKISIHSDKEMWIHMDNEYFQDTNITVDVVPNAIQMVAAADLDYSLPNI